MFVDLVGAGLQPHSQSCRRRMEEALAAGALVKNARIRMQEWNKKVEKAQEDDDNGSKRRRLEEIEGQAMAEEDPDKLA